MTDTTKRIQAPRWMTLAIEVLEGKADLGRSTKSNADTQKITLGVVRTLMEGFALSDKQTEAFLNNIRKRVPGRSDFTWDGQIKLTPKQIMDANKNPKYADLLAQMGEEKRWIVEVKTALESKIRELEAHSESKEEWQQSLGQLWEVITDFRR